MLSSRLAQDGAQLFISAKTCTAIPARCALLRDALVQASLDPAVRSIEFIAAARVGAASIALNAIVLERDDGRYLLDVVPTRPLRDVEHERLAFMALEELGLPSIRLTTADIQQEPRFANSRLVWFYRSHAVGISIRMRILQVLSDDGPMKLRQLLDAVSSDRDPSPAIMALACLNLIELDLVTQPLGPATIARSRV